MSTHLGLIETNKDCFLIKRKTTHRLPCSVCHCRTKVTERRTVTVTSLTTRHRVGQGRTGGRRPSRCPLSPRAAGWLRHRLLGRRDLEASFQQRLAGGYSKDFEGHPSTDGGRRTRRVRWIPFSRHTFHWSLQRADLFTMIERGSSRALEKSFITQLSRSRLSVTRNASSSDKGRTATAQGP